MKNFIFTLITIALIACNTDEVPTTDQCNPSFDQQAFFTRIVNENILSEYNELSDQLDLLKNKTESFLANPSEANLIFAQETFKNAYNQWQKVAQFEFGPAKEVFLRNSVNNFPLNEAELLENIQTGLYDFDMPDNFDKGFPALDFLLFGLSANSTEIVNSYILGTNADNYKKYLSDVVTDIDTRVKFTNEKWRDSYQNEFINNSGTAAGTALSLMVNGFNENYELIKREKLGIPSGALTLNIPNPDRVEAFHSGLSTTLLRTSLTATINLFNNGFDEYLDAANASKNDALLSEIISNQFDKTVETIEKLSSSLTEEIENNPDSVLDTYNEISKQLVNIKTDLPSMLCVSITYIDNPSDSD